MAEKKPAPELYDGTANQRFAFEISEGSETFETAHILRGVTDERYRQFLKEANIQGTEDDVDNDVAKATIALWRDLIVSVENVEVPDGVDFRDLIDSDKEIVPVIGHLLAVAPVEDAVKNNGVRVLGGDAKTVVVTEAYFNGRPIQQRHELRKKTIEDSKKYDQICRREYRRERMGGGLKRKEKVYFVPQQHAKAEMYDEMVLQVTGFKGDVVPLRFKAAVIDSLFVSGIDEKKLAKQAS